MSARVFQNAGHRGHAPVRIVRKRDRCDEYTGRCLGSQVREAVPERAGIDVLVFARAES